MTYFVTQYANFFFILRKVKGYTGNMITPCTKISEKEYRKLYYSKDIRELLHTVEGPNRQYIDIKIQGNANQILGRDVMTLNVQS